VWSREPDIRVEGNFTKNRYWFFLNTGQKIAQVHPKEELRGPKVRMHQTKPNGEGGKERG